MIANLLPLHDDGFGLTPADDGPVRVPLRTPAMTAGGPTMFRITKA